MAKRLSSTAKETPDEILDLIDYARNVAPKQKKNVPSYQQLLEDKAPEFRKQLCGLREKLKKERAKGKVVIVVMGTGGTFQSEPTPDGFKPTGTLRESFEALQLPKDDTIYLELCDLMNLDSSQLTVEQWRFLAEMIIELEEECGDSYDGIIITHGTDTMAKGASYLSYMLRGFPKSIIFTGSQYPARQDGTDAKDQMERAIIASKLACGVNRRITEIMVVCGMKAVRATWAKKQGDETTDVYGSWNQPTLNFDATDWSDAVSEGKLYGLAPALLDFGTGKSTNHLKYANHAIEFGSKGEFEPFTKILSPSDLYIVKMSDRDPVSFAQFITQQKVIVIEQLGSATADDALVATALYAAGLGKIVLRKDAFADSSAQAGLYAAGAALSSQIEHIMRPLPVLNTSPDSLEAKTNYVMHKLNMQPLECKKNMPNIGPVYCKSDLRRFYDAMEQNMVGELV